MVVNNDPYVTLEHAFNEIFVMSNYKSCLLTIGMNTVAIFMPFPDVFKVFDSHSRDLHGMPCASGYCFLTSIEGVQHLVDYFQLTSGYCGPICAAPFELKGVKCNKRLDLSNTNNTDCRLTEQHEIHKSAEIQNNNIVQRKNYLLAERKSILEKQRECMRVLRKNESSEKREKRLAKIR
jgi:hypothetical protein